MRNERALEAIREELEELEEQLTDSIADSIKGKQVHFCKERYPCSDQCSSISVSMLYFNPPGTHVGLAGDLHPCWAWNSSMVTKSGGIVASGLSIPTLIFHVFQAAKEGKDPQQVKKRKRTTDSDDEYAAADDSDDEFYDRTVTTGGPKEKAVGKEQAAVKGGKVEPAKVESAETLYAKRWERGS